MRFNTLTIALKSLRRNRVRTILTVLGIIIGIMAVITVMSAGNGLQSYITGEISKFGMDVIEVEIKVPNTSHVSTQNIGGIAQGISITTLTLADAEAIKKLPGIKNDYSSVITLQQASYQEANKQAMIWGTTASFIDIDKTGLESGRFFTEEEDRSLAADAVIGTTIKDKFFGNDDPLGKIIKIGKEKFLVIGVLNKRGTMAFFDLDNMIYVPVRTLQKKIMGIDHIANIMIQVYDQNRTDEAVAEITDLMRQQHDITDPDKDDFSVMSMQQGLDIYNTIFGAINLLLAAIAGISLVVGGVGIMNIMYVSVMERTYEIGLRKSFGATRRNILWQFLWEAIVITIFGAVIGLILGVLFSYLVSFVANTQGLTWNFVISANSVVMSIGASFLIGIVFGVFPAIAAARLDPVEALRSQK